MHVPYKGSAAAITVLVSGEVQMTIYDAGLVGPVKERILNSGAETVGSTPEQFAATIKTDMARVGKVIKNAGIRAQ